VSIFFFIEKVTGTLDGIEGDGVMQVNDSASAGGPKQLTP
jgi:hypothetical protein